MDRVELKKMIAREIRTQLDLQEERIIGRVLAVINSKETTRERARNAKTSEYIENAANVILQKQERALASAREDMRQENSRMLAAGGGDKQIAQLSNMSRQICLDVSKKVSGEVYSKVISEINNKIMPAVDKKLKWVDFQSRDESVLMNDYQQSIMAETSAVGNGIFDYNSFMGE